MQKRPKQKYTHEFKEQQAIKRVKDGKTVGAVAPCHVDAAPMRTSVLDDTVRWAIAPIFSDCQVPRDYRPAF